MLLTAALICAPTPPQAPAPAWRGDPEASALLELDVQAAMRATEGYGAMPGGPWSVHLHTEGAGFDQATGAPPQRSAAWIGTTLHLRPMETLRRRDLGAILRHELVHRRLSHSRLRPWEEEARCLFAEAHPKPPEAWPPAPPGKLQDRLDLALGRGTTASQAWAYAWLRAWVAGNPLPSAPPPRKNRNQADPWKPSR